MITKKNIKGWVLHAVVAVLAFLLTLAAAEVITGMGWMFPIAFFMGTIAWEIRQKGWQYRKLDTIIDVLIANGIYTALMLRTTIL